MTRFSVFSHPYGNGLLIVLQFCFTTDKFTDLDIIANAIAMFVAGSESVSSGLSFCLYQLALHQDIQNKVREEIRSVMKKHGEFNNDFLVDLQYTGMVLAGEYWRKLIVIFFFFEGTNLIFIYIFLTFFFSKNFNIVLSNL